MDFKTCAEKFHNANIFASLGWYELVGKCKPDWIFQIYFQFFSSSRSMQQHFIWKWISKSHRAVVFKPKKFIPAHGIFAERCYPSDPSQGLQQIPSNRSVRFWMDDVARCWNISAGYQWISQSRRLQCVSTRLEWLLRWNVLPSYDKYFKNFETGWPESEEIFRWRNKCKYVPLCRTQFWGAFMWNNGTWVASSVE